MCSWFLFSQGNCLQKLPQTEKKLYTFGRCPLVNLVLALREMPAVREDGPGKTGYALSSRPLQLTRGSLVTDKDWFPQQYWAASRCGGTSMHSLLVSL